MSSSRAAGEGGAVAVFAPTLLLTVTIERGSRAGPELHLHPGGQGFWIARMAAGLRGRVTLSGIAGGEAGAVVAALLAEERFEAVLVRSAGASGSYVHDRRGGARQAIVEIAGSAFTRHELDDLYGGTLAAALDRGTLVLAGPLDIPDVGELYGRLASDARRNGVAVVADITGEAMTGALGGGVTLLKISEEDLVADGMVRAGDEDGLVGVLGDLHAAGAENVLLSRGNAGAFALVAGRLVEARGPAVTPADARGAGDSMTAAVAVGLAEGLPPEDWLRLAVAAGVVNATRRGLGTGNRTEIEQVAGHVQIDTLTRVA